MHCACAQADSHLKATVVHNCTPCQAAHLLPGLLQAADNRQGQVVFILQAGGYALWEAPSFAVQSSVPAMTATFVCRLTCTADG